MVNVSLVSTKPGIHELGFIDRTVQRKSESSHIPGKVASSIPVNILQRQVWIDDLQIIYQSLYSNLNVINI